MDPVEHYLEWGAAKGRRPTALFDAEWYLRTYPDAREDGRLPFLHFMQKGARAGCRPNPLFDVDWYVTEHGLDENQRRNPVGHYLSEVRSRTLRTSAMFDAAWYLAQYRHVIHDGLDPLSHYLTIGEPAGHGPNPLFDAHWYADRYGIPGGAAAAFADYRDHAGSRSPHPLFDAPWYLSVYPEVAQSGMDPLAHYLTEGTRRGYNPHPLFDTAYYLAQGGGQAPREHETPLVDYLADGRNWDRSTHPLFQAEWYRRQIPDIVAQGYNPLRHYVTHGAPAGYGPNPLFDYHWYADRYGIPGGAAAAFADYRDHAGSRSPHPLFDAPWYLGAYPEVAQSGMDPLAHYLTEGARRGYNPHPLFDTAYYLAQGGGQAPREHETPLVDYLADGRNWSRPTHPLFHGGWYLQHNGDVAAHGINPLRHFVQSGFREGRDPCALFRTAWYAERYPDVPASGRNPLVDYVTGGAYAGRDPNVIFDSDWYLLHNGDVADAKLDPLSHYVTSGWREGRNPSALFDGAWYQARYPETNRPDIDPLEHYLTMGMAAGYLIRPADRLTHDCDALDIPFEILRSPASLVDREVCLLVTYAGDGRVADHVLSQVKALRQAGLAVVLVVVTEGLNEPLAPVLDRVDGLLVRLNHGWDFAAWATALAAFPDVWQARLLILANDSLYGPTSQEQLCAILDAVRASDKDLVALCDSHQVKRHLMSFFTAVTPAGLKQKALRDFWNGVRSNRDKQTVINEYEVRSIERWEHLGIRYEVLFPDEPTESPPLNPTLHGWRDLLVRGFPFVKAQLLRERPHQIEIDGWEEAFGGNPGLVPEIEAHLALRRRHAVVPMRPVPSPKQRFVQGDALKTYYGATTSCRPAEEVDLALEVPFRPVGGEALALPERVAVVAHVFYPDFCADLAAHLRHIPVPADLFVSTDTEAKKQEILDALAGYANGALEIRVLPNIGRDIAPMLVGFRDVFARYDVFLHLHSKKSPHDPVFAPWRDYLLANILGCDATVRSILHLLTAEDVGIVFSQHFGPVRHLLNFGYNFERMKDLLARCGVALSKDLVLEFPSSSFFWGRSAALAPLLDLGLDWSDFPAEAGQVDGTIAHAIERSLLYVTERAGLRWAKVAQAGRVPVETLVPVQGAADAALALARVHRPLLRNRIPRPKEAHLVSEINPIATRRDRSERPRLNLLIPTLQPAKTFGGLTTAIRLFEELAAAFGDAVDLRIVSVSERIDLNSMLRFPGYRLLPISTASDALPKVVLDASERQRGYLTVRRNDVFVATAWWTAHNAYQFQDDQAMLHGRKQPVVYLIQDHEPDFYGWSSQYGQAQRTYARPDDTVALLNSEELANFHRHRYGLGEARVVPFQLNASIGAALSPRPRERIILVYGRPGTARNCFGLLCRALGLWQRAEPVEADRWRIVSAGEDFDPVAVSQVRNLEVRGKLSLAEYGEMLSKAAVGVSLMASPHPSYPPLEMAYAGLRTVTNAFEEKDLSKRSPNILSVPSLDAEEIAAALAEAVRAASPTIGTIVPETPLATIPCAIPPYDPAELAGRIRNLFS
ncbi:rhamnosyltransferase WsaF family glycosyltransferase [Methylobacterium crusticola]|uniref:rhamnosyltransferase WsaF family glycosyltransferase n=1 Tax=Methylobacterium crusticola TaxID=1697972 RepID=UPI001EE1B443|nr:rhamnan synthesis F family protein [Methylobacterium crusticola]